MQASVPSVGQDETAVRLSARLLVLPVISEFGAPGVTVLFRSGSIVVGKPGFCFRYGRDRRLVMRLLSAVWLTRE